MSLLNDETLKRGNVAVDGSGAAVGKIPAVTQVDGSGNATGFGLAELPRRFPSSLRPFAAATPLNASANIRAVGYDAVTDLLICASQTSVAASADSGTTIGGPMGVPLSAQTNSGNQVGRIVRFGTLWVCLINNLASTAAEIYTSPAPATAGGTCTWTLRQTLTGGSDGRFFTCIDASSTAVLVGEYGDPLTTGTKNPHVWRSTDGITWTSVWSASGGNNRHIHAVAADPYAPGTWYMTNGDGISPCMFKSTDDGVTWTGMNVLPSTRQAVQISFTEAYIWLAPDTAQGAMWLVDRATGTTIKAGSTGDHRRIAVPTPGLHPYGRTTSASPTLEDFTDATFTVDLIGCKVTAAGIPNGATIIAVPNTTAVTMSANATATATNIPYRLWAPEHFWSDNFFGAVDPATDAYYFVAVGNSDMPQNGGRRGLFYVPFPGGPVELLDVLPSSTNTLFVADGYVYAGPMRRPVITFS